MSPIDPSRYAYPDVDRPWIRANFVTTIDGAAHDSEGVTGSLGGTADEQVFAMLRDMADVIVVGAETARTEKYGPAETPIVVVSHSLNLPPRLVQPGIIVATTADAPARRVHRIRAAGVEVLTFGVGALAWPDLLDELAKRGWLKVLCEGGPTLFGELIEADLIDELCLTVAPVLAAGDAPRIARSVSAVAHAMRLELAQPVGDVLFTRWIKPS